MVLNSAAKLVDKSEDSLVEKMVDGKVYWMVYCSETVLEMLLVAKKE
jgi:hypothetical protein